MAFGPLMISLASTQLNLAEKALLANEKIGGVILFKENYQSKTQITRLIATIRFINPEMLIAVDHEGGRVQRFDNDEFTKLPDAKFFGELYDKSPHESLTKAREFGQVMAQELLECGVNFSFAPTLDVHTDQSKIIGQYRRAFHSDIDISTMIAANYAKGMQNAGMPVTGKHFPEHGICTADSHLELPIDNRSEDEILQGLSAYHYFIQHKLLDIVMPAHVCYPNLDANIPAGFSKKIIQHLLRDKLEFNGAIISDCLSMGALTDEPHIRVNRALQAGQDMVIFSHQSPAVISEILPKTDGNSKKAKQRLNALLKKSNYQHQSVSAVTTGPSPSETTINKKLIINKTVLDKE